VKHLIITLMIISVLIFGGVFISSSPLECGDCKNGHPCEDTFDCGELGVCICWYSGEQESITGTPGKNGICQMQSQ